MNLLHILANDGFICVNKHIIKQLGLEEAVLIGELASIYTYNDNKGALEEDWFYATIERIQDNTGLSEYKQQQVISRLCDIGLLKQKLQGMPRKRFLKFNKDKLYEIALNEADTQFPKIQETVPENSGDSSQILPEQAPENSEAIYNNNNNIKYKNRDNTQAGEISNQNKNNILGKNNQKETKEPKGSTRSQRVIAPKISPADRLPKSIIGKIQPWDKYPETYKALQDYALFLMDTYNEPTATINNKITQICRMASKVPQGIEIICNFNIDKNYRSVYKPSDYKKQMSDAPVISQEFTGEFVTDDNGEIEEV